MVRHQTIISGSHRSQIRRIFCRLQTFAAVFPVTEQAT